MFSRHCARCGLELTDAASREHGTGPICRKLDNAALARLIPSNVNAAMGAAEGFPVAALALEAQPTWFQIVEALMSGETADDWRSTVKRAEWLASWVPPHGVARAILTSVIAHLGYVTLAALWQGEAATGDASVRFEGGRLWLKGPRNKGAQSALKSKVPGVYFRSYTKEWTAPASSADAFAHVVATHWLKVTGMTDATEQAKAYVAALPPAPTVVPCEAPVIVEALATVEPEPTCAPVTFAIVKDYVQIKSPYNGTFIAAIKALPYKDRGWNKIAKVWEVSLTHLDAARKAVVDAYGVEPVTL